MKYSILFLMLISGIINLADSVFAESKKSRPPNVIYIMADDLGYAELGCYGQKWIKTPNIDRIAAEGIRFTQHYCGNAVCAPSRCCLMTGKHPGHAYIRNNGNPQGRKKNASNSVFPGQNPIPDSEVTIAEVLKQKRYATAAIGKWGLGFEGSVGDPNNQGFDLFYGFIGQSHAHNHYPRFLWNNGIKEYFPGNDRKLTGSVYSQDRFTEMSLQFIKDNKDRPFFLYVPFAIPHLAIQSPESSLAEYRGKIPEEKYKHKGYIKHPFPRAGYASMISHMDRDVGKIMKLVADLGLDDNTIIMFTSDNGPAYRRLGGSDSDFFKSAGPFKGLKGSLYEGGIRIPMVARWPGKIQPGSETEHISAFWDVMPTIAELTGTKHPEGLDGISFAPTLLGKNDQQKKHQYLYWEFPAYHGQQAVRMGKWKAVRQKIIAKKNPDPLKIQLYDLSKDIGESNDVSAENPEIVQNIRKIMKDSHTNSYLFPMKPIDK